MERPPGEAERIFQPGIDWRRTIMCKQMRCGDTSQWALHEVVSIHLLSYHKQTPFDFQLSISRLRCCLPDRTQRLENLLG
jgi:hypothetical protein